MPRAVSRPEQRATRLRARRHRGAPGPPAPPAPGPSARRARASPRGCPPPARVRRTHTHRPRRWRGGRQRSGSSSRSASQKASSLPYGPSIATAARSRPSGDGATHTWGARRNGSATPITRSSDTRAPRPLRARRQPRDPHAPHAAGPLHRDRLQVSALRVRSPRLAHANAVPRDLHPRVTRGLMRNRSRGAVRVNPAVSAMADTVAFDGTPTSIQAPVSSPSRALHAVPEAPPSMRSVRQGRCPVAHRRRDPNRQPEGLHEVDGGPRRRLRGGLPRERRPPRAPAHSRAATHRSSSRLLYHTPPASPPQRAELTEHPLPLHGVRRGIAETTSQHGSSPLAAAPPILSWRCPRAARARMDSHHA